MPAPAQVMTTIPQEFRGDLVRLGIYDGPWRIPLIDAHFYLRQLRYQMADEGNGGGGTAPEGDPIAAAIAAMAAALAGGGSSGSSASAGMTAKQKANLRNSYIAMLQSFGIDLTKNMKALVDQGVKQEWSTTSFLVHLRQTKDYKQHFPGIKSDDGLSEGAYNAQYKQYSQISGDENVKLTRQQFGTLLRKNVGANEWRLRVEFLHKSSRNKQFFDQLEITARKLGIIKPNSQLSKKELFNAMTHRGDGRLEKLMEEANLRYLLQSIDFTVGPQGGVTRKQLLSFIKGFEAQGIDVEGFTSEQFAGLANRVKTLIPAARRVGAGITERDLWTLEFGGPNQADIARHAEAILATEGEKENMQARAVVVEDNEGSRLLGGTPQAPKGL